MAGTVHRLQRQHLLVGALRDEHVLAELLPMARGFPEGAVEQLRRLDLDIAAMLEPVAQIILDGAPQGPALGMPENTADRLLLLVEEVELAAEPAMVPLLGLLEHGEI